ncbi:MAG: M24 family metallopeptidase, partial [Clostridia bacterium]|nr:M24 family metallopeptidase [Clostridia bacterium]
IISDAGFGGNFNHALGHGVGLEIHELPNLSYKSNAILKEGNIVTVEPGIYIENFCGIRIEDMVLVTENGYENFTQSSKDFIIL